MCWRDLHISSGKLNESSCRTYIKPVRLNIDQVHRMLYQCAGRHANRIGESRTKRPHPTYASQNLLWLHHLKSTRPQFVRSFRCPQVIFEIHKSTPHFDTCSFFVHSADIMCSDLCYCSYGSCCSCSSYSLHSHCSIRSCKYRSYCDPCGLVCVPEVRFCYICYRRHWKCRHY